MSESKVTTMEIKSNPQTEFEKRYRGENLSDIYHYESERELILRNISNETSNERSDN